VFVDELSQGNAHLLLNRAGLVHMAGDAEELGTSVLLATQAGEPGAAPTADGRGHGHRLDVGHGGRATKDTHIGGEGGLQAGLASLALNALDEGGLLAADVGASTHMDVHVKGIAGATGILANESSLVRLIDGHLHVGGFMIELSSDVNVGCLWGGRKRKTRRNKMRKMGTKTEKF